MMKKIIKYLLFNVEDTSTEDTSGFCREPSSGKPTADKAGSREQGAGRRYKIQVRKIQVG